MKDVSQDRGPPRVAANVIHVHCTVAGLNMTVVPASRRFQSSFWAFFSSLLSVMRADGYLVGSTRGGGAP